MSEAKHTPGPWQIELPLESEMDSSPIIAAHHGKTLVAEILGPLTDEDGPARGHYDCFLIRAAPALLRVAQSVLRELENFSCRPDGAVITDSPFAGAVHMLRAAVALARGEESVNA